MQCMLHRFCPEHLQLPEADTRRNGAWSAMSTEWHRKLLNSAGFDGCQFWSSATATKRQLSFFTGTLNKHQGTSFCLGQQNLQPDLSKKSVLTYSTVLFNAWISQEVQLSENGVGWIEQVQLPRRWHWLDTPFHGSLRRTPYWFHQQQDHEDRWFTYLADKTIILAFMSYWSNCSLKKHFLGLSELFKHHRGSVNITSP